MGFTIVVFKKGNFTPNELDHLFAVRDYVPMKDHVFKQVNGVTEFPYGSMSGTHFSDHPVGLFTRDWNLADDKKPLSVQEIRAALAKWEQGESPENLKNKHLYKILKAAADLGLEVGYYY